MLLETSRKVIFIATITQQLSRAAFPSHAPGAPRLGTNSQQRTFRAELSEARNHSIDSIAPVQDK